MAVRGYRCAIHWALQKQRERSMRTIVLICGIVLAACQPAPPAPPATILTPEHQAFWTALQALCGQAFEGAVAEDSTADERFAGKTMVMHVRECRESEVRVPFHVGDDRSRTWVLTRLPSGLRLKHDHRHEDGSEDEITQYGGDTRAAGTPVTQEFHADDLTARLVPPAATNIWTVEIFPGQRFAYALRREGTDRRFRVEFDLTRPVDPPPPPWGASG
jgi:hypothetical protein